LKAIHYPVQLFNINYYVKVTVICHGQVLYQNCLPTSSLHCESHCIISLHLWLLVAQVPWN